MSADQSGIQGFCEHQHRQSGDRRPRLKFCLSEPREIVKTSLEDVVGQEPEQGVGP